MKPWKGVFVAIVTPFKKGVVDHPALKTLVNHLLEGGVRGFIPCGTTGEGSALSEDEFISVVETILSQTRGKAMVLPGTGTNSTQKTKERTQLAKKLGTDGAMVISPYYVKPTQEGLIRHFSEVVETVDFPIMIYNAPLRTAVNILPETIEKLSTDPRIAAWKECAPYPQVAEIIRRVGQRIAVFTGDDDSYLPTLVLGGAGVVSVAGNIVPETLAEIWQAVEQADIEEARRKFLSLLPLIQLLFIESNPIPVKAAAAYLGWIEDEIRTPLSSLSEPNRKKLFAEVDRLSLRRKK